LSLFINTLSDHHLSDMGLLTFVKKTAINFLTYTLLILDDSNSTSIYYSEYSVIPSVTKYK